MAGKGLGRAQAERAIYEFGEFVFDPERYELRRAGRRVALEPKVVDLLTCLIAARDRVVSKDELLDVVWPGEHVTEGSLTRCVSLARKAVGDGGGRQAIIQTVHGRGYRFVAPVIIAAQDAALAVDTGAGNSAPTPGDRNQLPRSTLFVGREAELAVLRAALDAASRGTGSLLLMSGEPGIGKTRTAEEFMEVATGAGVAARIGRCREEAGAPPFWPWSQILRTELEAHAPQTLHVMLGSHTSDLAGIVPELSTLLPGLRGSEPLQSAQARLRLFDSAARFLERAARAAPRLIVLDDLHRADEPSLLLLEFVAAELGSTRLVLVGTHRPLSGAAVARRGRLLAALSRGAHARCMVLGGFSRPEVARFFEAATGHGGSEPIITLLHDQSGGNPFFLHQLAPLLAAPRADEVGAPHLAARLPQTVREAVACQLDGLSARTRQLLRAAAVLGREFPLALLERMTSLPAAQLIQLLQAAVRAGVIVETHHQVTQYRFAHILVRDVVYGGMPATERARLHLRALDAIEALYATTLDAHLAALAAHAFEALAVGGGARAIRYAVRAAAAATAQTAYEEAAHHYERALEVRAQTAADDAVLHCDLLLALAESKMRAGHRAEAVETFRHAAVLARGIGAGARLARAALGVAPGSLAIEAGVYDDLLVRLLEDALSILTDDEAALRAAVLGRLAVALYWSPETERRQQLSAEAVRVAACTDDAATRASAAVARCVANWGPDNCDDRVAALPAALHAAVAADDREQTLTYRMFWITTLIERGDVAAVEREVEIYTAEASRIRQPQALWCARLLQGMVALLHGEFQRAEQLSHEFLALGSRAGDANAAQSFAAVSIILLRERGQLGKMIEPLRALAASRPEVMAYRCGLAWVCANSEYHAEAVRELAALTADGCRSVPRNAHWLINLALLSDASTALRDRSSARMLGELLAPFADRYVTVGFGTACYGPVTRYLGVNARTAEQSNEAADWFEAAIAATRRIGLAPWLVRCQLDYADMLHRGEPAQRSRIRALVREALPDALRLGMIDAAAQLTALADA